MKKYLQDASITNNNPRVEQEECNVSKSTAIKTLYVNKVSELVLTSYSPISGLGLTID